MVPGHKNVELLPTVFIISNTRAVQSKMSRLYVPNQRFRLVTSNTPNYDARNSSLRPFPPFDQYIEKKTTVISKSLPSLLFTLRFTL
jgi:hypothetical protein